MGLFMISLHCWENRHCSVFTPTRPLGRRKDRQTDIHSKRKTEIKCKKKIKKNFKIFFSIFQRLKDYRLKWPMSPRLRVGREYALNVLID